MLNVSRHLADDFVCIESDCTVLNKEQFLINAEKGSDVTDYKLEKVNVRLGGTWTAIGGSRTAIEPPSALEEAYSRLKRSSSSR